MTSVALFRNLNQGQRGHPATAQLLEAFEASGAASVRPVRSNGTVLFDAVDPESCIADVVTRLRARTPWRDVAFVRPLEWFADRADEFPPGATELVELSLFEGELPHPAPLPGKGCTIVHAGPGFAITVNERPGTSQATPTLEKALGSPATSRAASTVYRMLDAT